MRFIDGCFRKRGRLKGFIDNGFGIELLRHVFFQAVSDVSFVFKHRPAAVDSDDVYVHTLFDGRIFRLGARAYIYAAGGCDGSRHGNIVHAHHILDLGVTDIISFLNPRNASLIIQNIDDGIFGKRSDFRGHGGSRVYVYF